MLKITVGTNTNRKTVMVTEDTTLRQCLEENDINYATGQTSLDGCVLQPGDMDKTFAAMRYREGLSGLCSEDGQRPLRD